MTIKERTNIFNLCVIVFNVAIGLLVEGAIIALLMFSLSSNPNLGESMPIQVVLPLVLLVGLIVAMSISVKTVSWAIEKFNLHDKLDPKVVSKYQKKIK
ncbi:MAG: hypothetical protein KBT11_03540 [Treponema sp.]|nr:hypothetical protein [Candidatus Treponema equifaecale]